MRVPLPLKTQECARNVDHASVATLGLLRLDTEFILLLTAAALVVNTMQTVAHGIGGMADGGMAACSVASAAAEGPCDILVAAGNPCVAAHSTVRALYAKYDGPLYTVRTPDGTSANISAMAAG